MVMVPTESTTTVVTPTAVATPIVVTPTATEITTVYITIDDDAPPPKAKNLLPKFVFYKDPINETNWIISIYDSCTLPHIIAIDPMPHICSLWGIIVFVIIIIYYIIWGIWKLFISIIYIVLLFLSMLFITPYLCFFVVREY